MSLAGYYVSWSETPCVTIATTNGLASGNSLEEAICHALAELIERDDWTIADLVSNRLSRVLAHDTGAALWLQDLNPSIDVTTLPEAPRQLAERFVAAGLTVELKNLTSANCLPTILASVSEAIAPSFSHSHHGVGTHPDVEVAATRALTEVAQSRAVDISAVREDISLPGDDVGSWLLHIKRTGEVDHEAWAFRRSARAISISSLPSHRNDDIAADIRLMLERLQASGLTQVIVVDLSLPDTPASVVRAIVPGLESWTVDHSRVGSRARAAVASALSKLLPNAETVPPPER
jgi:ribosomal protein S12 methylthiotransferase accessory factor